MCEGETDAIGGEVDALHPPFEIEGCARLNELGHHSGQVVAELWCQVPFESGHRFANGSFDVGGHRKLGHVHLYGSEEPRPEPRAGLDELPRVETGAEIGEVSAGDERDCLGRSVRRERGRAEHDGRFVCVNEAEPGCVARVFEDGREAESHDAGRVMQGLRQRIRVRGSDPRRISDRSQALRTWLRAPR